jgi:hypothetical protein
MPTVKLSLEVLFVLRQQVFFPFWLPAYTEICYRGDQGIMVYWNTTECVSNWWFTVFWRRSRVYGMLVKTMRGHGQVISAR